MKVPNLTSLNPFKYNNYALPWVLRQIFHSPLSPSSTFKKLTKIMASGSITLWQIEEGKMEPLTNFIFLGSKITEDSDCSHEIKRHLLLARKAMTNPDSVLKTKTLLSDSESYGFSSSHVQMWELDHKEGWVPRTDAFKLWCWRRLLRLPWTAMRSNQSILKEINPECSLEGLMLKLKLQHFGHLM